jgi:hypothetical protein
MAILLVMKNILQGSKTRKDPHSPSPGGYATIFAKNIAPLRSKIADRHRKVRQSEHYLYIVITYFVCFVTLCTNGEGRKATTFTSER